MRRKFVSAGSRNGRTITAASPTLLGFPAMKVGTMHSITLIDDREKTPNFGKPLFNPTSVLAVPEMAVVRRQILLRENGADKAVGEVSERTLPEGDRGDQELRGAGEVR